MSAVPLGTALAARDPTVYWLVGWAFVVVTSVAAGFVSFSLGLSKAYAVGLILFGLTSRGALFVAAAVLARRVGLPLPEAPRW